MHAQRNAESHTAPVREDTHVPIGIHMAMAMYLYATMINVKSMERGEGVKMYPVIEDGTSYSMVAEP